MSWKPKKGVRHYRHLKTKLENKKLERETEIETETEIEIEIETC